MFIKARRDAPLRGRLAFLPAQGRIMHPDWRQHGCRARSGARDWPCDADSTMGRCPTPGNTVSRASEMSVLKVSAQETCSTWSCSPRRQRFVRHILQKMAEHVLVHMLPRHQLLVHGGCHQPCQRAAFHHASEQVRHALQAVRDQAVASLHQLLLETRAPCPGHARRIHQRDAVARVTR